MPSPKYPLLQVSTPMCAPWLHNAFVKEDYKPPQYPHLHLHSHSRIPVIKPAPSSPQDDLTMQLFAALQDWDTLRWDRLYCIRLHISLCHIFRSLGLHHQYGANGGRSVPPVSLGKQSSEPEKRKMTKLPWSMHLYSPMVRG